MKYQIKECEKIITAIENGKYHDAAVRIRYNLNDNSYLWYKDINAIIDNQLLNLFYDIEHGTTLTVEFFKRTIIKLQYYEKCNAAAAAADGGAADE